MHRFEGGGGQEGATLVQNFISRIFILSNNPICILFFKFLCSAISTHFLYERPVWTLLLDFLDSAFFSRSFIKSRLNEIVPISKRPSL